MMRELMSLVRTWWKIVLMYSVLTVVYGFLALVWTSYYVLTCQWCCCRRHHHKHPGYHHQKCSHNHHPSMQMKFQEDSQ